MVLEIPVHRIGDGVAAPIAAVVLAAHGEQCQLLRLLYGQEAQQNLVEQCKDGRVRADAECERQHRHGCKYRVFHKHPRGKTNVSNDFGHVQHPPQEFLSL